MATGGPAPRVVHLLPIVEKLCLLNDSGCREVLRLVSKRFPEVGMDIVHAQTGRGREEPLGSLMTAARVAAILMGNVRGRFKGRQTRFPDSLTDTRACCWRRSTQPTECSSCRSWASRSRQLHSWLQAALMSGPPTSCTLWRCLSTVSDTCPCFR